MNPAAPLSLTAAVLERGIADRVFPGAVVEIGRREGPIATLARGTLTYAPDAPPAGADTIYDLASLTKILATATVMVSEFDSGRMRLDDRVRHFIPSWTGEERQIVTIQDLLEHSSGLPAHRPYYKWRQGRASVELAICEEPLEYAARTRSVYSDAGFILLGFCIEHAAKTTLDRLFDDWRRAAINDDVEIRFGTDAAWYDRVASSEVRDDGDDRRGIVHDENAAALDGVAGHAGLFGTAAAVGACARWWMASSALPRFSQRSLVPGSSRGLGWDTMLLTSSCGTRLSPQAVGHTGFTGTSLWIDPPRNLYVAFLSNRVHPTRAGEGIQSARRALHDAVILDLES